MKHAWLAVLLATTGCVDALKSEYPERRFWTLAAERPGDAAPPGKDGVLRVRRFNASKLSEGNELVSRTGEAEYETDFYNVYFSPPASQVTEQVHRWMGGSGLFSAVVGAGSTMPETHVLEGSVVSLYYDEREKMNVAVLELQVMLVRVSSDPSAIVFQKTYRAQNRPASRKSQSIVKAWNAGLAGILADLEADLAKVDRSPKK